MTLVRAQVILAGTSEKLDPRSRLAVSGVQIVRAGGMFWSKKPAFLRNVPYTAVSPHAGQIQTRIKFGKTASGAKGKKGFELGLPVAAAAVKKGMPGYTAPDRLSPENYPSRTRRTVHTLAELEAIAKAKGISV